MAQQAAHLVDRVLPFVPVRQWVVSLPFALRFRVANDHRLLTAVLGVCLRAVLGLQRDRARRILGLSGRCGAVTVVQRFGGALNMNVHFHVMVLDGVHVETVPGRVVFRALARPTAAEMQGLVETIARRVRALLRRRGLLEEDEERLAGDVDGEEEAVLATCRAASARGLSVLAGRSGRGVRRVRLPDPDGPATAPRPYTTGVAATAGGVNVHVGPSVPPWDRSRLERLCRYALRPPLARGRLRATDDGLLSYELAHPWRDGTRAILLEPLELLERLVALVPAPGRNLLRYHGTLAPNARWRKLIVPPAPVAAEGGAVTREGAAGGCEGRHASGGDGAGRDGPARGAPRSDWIPWAELMRRVWAEDVLACPRCGGRMRVIAAVTSREAIRRILEHLGLPPRAPPLSPARLPDDGWECGRPEGERES
jgi:hypothetical protein